MSADLFAEFGGSKPTQPTDRSRATSTSQTNSLIPDLESFEGIPSANPWSDGNSSTIQQAQHPNKFQTYRNQPQYDDSVLFDASLETFSNDGSDEFGDFESAETQPTQNQPIWPSQGPHHVTAGGPSYVKSSNTPGVNLIDSLSIEDEPLSVSTAPVNPTAGNAHARSMQSKESLIPQEPAEMLKDEPSEDWGDFVDGPPSPSPKETSKTGEVDQRELSSAPAQPERTIPKTTTKSMEQALSTQVRPTNIPPPSVLLQMFPQLFHQLRQEAMEAKRNTQDTGTLENVTSRITYTLKTGARVIAGRTLRWKRDSILSQSMKIGPARSGKAGGMKLNTVNKNENVKEQQEAVDALSMWRDRTALFNSVLQISGKRAIPVIAEDARVTTATSTQGAIKASHACALCGLKRDERLPKVDDKVEDSFGEWWTDHWGHTDCKQFWEANIKLLGQR